MNYSKVFRTISLVLFFAGFALIFGSAGTSDYMSAIGEYRPIWKTALMCLCGFALMTPMIFAFRDYDLGDEDDEWEDWDDEIYND